MSLPTTDVLQTTEGDFIPYFNQSSIIVETNDACTTGGLTTTQGNIDLAATPATKTFVALDACYLGTDTTYYQLSPYIVNPRLTFLLNGSPIFTTLVMLYNSTIINGGWVTNTLNNNQCGSNNFPPASYWPTGGFLAFQSFQLATLNSTNNGPYNSPNLVSFVYPLGNVSSPWEARQNPSLCLAREFTFNFDTVEFGCNFFGFYGSKNYFGMSLAVYSI